MIYEFNAAEVFQVAIEIEKNGKTFYEKAGEIVSDDEVKTLFASLAQEEVKHEKLFRELKAQLPESFGKETVWDPEHETDRYLKVVADMHVFGPGSNIEKHIAGVSDTISALRMAIKFEKDSIILFLSLREETGEKIGRDIVGRLVSEEQKHLKRLSLQLGRILK